MPLHGRSLFWYFFANRNEKEPINYPWRLDLGKIVIPNVFVDIELINLLDKHYEPTIKIVRKLDGMPLLVITKSCVEQYFRLSTQALTKIDIEHSKNEYQKIMKFGKYMEISHFMCKGHNNKLMYVDNMGPHLVD